MTYTNESLGVALDINEDGSHCLRSTRPRFESMMADDRVYEWVDQQLAHHESLTSGDYVL